MQLQVEFCDLNVGLTLDEVMNKDTLDGTLDTDWTIKIQINWDQIMEFKLSKIV